MRTASLIFILLLTAISISVPQGNTIDYNELLNRFVRLEQEYKLTTELGKVGKINEHEEEKRNENSLEQYTELLTQLYSLRPNRDSLKFFITYRIGELHHYFYKTNEALTHYRQAISIKKKLPSLADSLLFKPYLFSGSLLYTQHKFDSAMLYYKLAEKILVQNGNKLEEKERLYNTLGAMYYEMGNYRLARNYLLKAIEVLSPSDPYYKELLVNYKINLASILNKLEAYDEAYEIYQQLLQTNINRNEILHNIGSINLVLGSNKQALSYFRKVNYNSSRIVNLQNDIAAAFLNLELYDSAKFYLQNSLRLNDSIFQGSTNVPKGLAYQYSGDLNSQLRQYNKALNYYQLALHQFYPAYNNDSISSNPLEFSGVFSYINLFTTLVSKADVLHTLFLQSNDQNWAELELETWHSAFKLADYVERTYESDEARLFLNKTKYTVHNKPIATAFALYNTTREKHFLEEVYYFDQKNKASILSLNEHIGDVTTNQEQKEQHRIKAAITRLSLQAARGADSTMLAGINREIRDYEIELGKLQDNKSSLIAYSERVPSLGKVQNLLDDNSALLSYHLSDSSFVATLITNNIAKGYQRKFYAGFENDLKEFINNLRNIQRDAGLVSSLSKRLYQFLIEDIAPDNIDRLIIIPDDELNYLPFEALSNNSGIYLVFNYSIQYQYSTTLLEEKELKLANAGTIAMAPFTNRGFHSDTYHFEVLPASGTEVKTTQGTIVTDTAATKERFINSLSDFEIIHLATHAVANDSSGNEGYIAFFPYHNNINNTLLYEKEIYNLDMDHTRLIVLSACETGAGSLVKGEGVMSLSRAFAYAGCSNIVTSLWKADDETTAMLMEHFHRYIQNGLTIDKALQESKKHLLSNPSAHPRMKHPAYWASFIYVGNYESEAKSWVWLFIPILSLLLLVLILKKVPPRRDRRSS